MKNIFYSFLFVLQIFVMASCLKSKEEVTCENRSVSEDSIIILNYIKSDNATAAIDALRHPSGLYYKILSPGFGNAPVLSSKVFIKYTGRLTNDTIFDSLTDASRSGWVLGTLIDGWKIGLPLISKGGKIKLYIPSALAYGCRGQSTIAPNQVLIFEVELVDLQ
jgi:FKBP-type peptidyl-prolyl cis-trans isomerase FkpA